MNWSSYGEKRFGPKQKLEKYKKDQAYSQKKTNVPQSEGFKNLFLKIILVEKDFNRYAFCENRFLTG